MFLNYLQNHPPDNDIISGCLGIPKTSQKKFHISMYFIPRAQYPKIHHTERVNYVIKVQNSPPPPFLTKIILETFFLMILSLEKEAHEGEHIRRDKKKEKKNTSLFFLLLLLSLSTRVSSATFGMQWCSWAWHAYNVDTESTTPGGEGGLIGERFLSCFFLGTRMIWPWKIFLCEEIRIFWGRSQCIQK